MSSKFYWTRYIDDSSLSLLINLGGKDSYKINRKANSGDILIIENDNSICCLDINTNLAKCVMTNSEWIELVNFKFNINEKVITINGEIETISSRFLDFSGKPHYILGNLVVREDSIFRPKYFPDYKEIFDVIKINDIIYYKDKDGNYISETDLERSRQILNS